MIALLTIHYHSLEMLCIQSDGGGGGRGVGKVERGVFFGSGGCLFAGGPGGEAI